MENFELGDEEFIPLCDLMKVVRLCENGAVAKHLIAEGQVKVDGEIELRKRAKIRKNQVIEYRGKKIKVV